MYECVLYTLRDIRCVFKVLRLVSGVVLGWSTLRL